MTSGITLFKKFHVFFQDFIFLEWSTIEAFLRKKWFHKVCGSEYILWNNGTGGSKHSFNNCRCTKQNFTTKIHDITIITVFLSLLLVSFCISANPCAFLDIWVFCHIQDISLDLCLEAHLLDPHVFFWCVFLSQNDGW